MHAVGPPLPELESRGNEAVAAPVWRAVDLTAREALFLLPHPGLQVGAARNDRPLRRSPCTELVTARPLREVADSDALRYVIGSSPIDAVPRLGPLVDEPYNSLAWLVSVQLIALHAGRRRHIDSDAPRGLTKSLVAETT